LLPTLVRLAASDRAVRTGVTLGLPIGGDCSVGGALLYDASFRGDAGREGLFALRCGSGDCRRGEPIDAVDFFLFNVGLTACGLGGASGRSFA
jgi:hypothetical protein